VRHLSLRQSIVWNRDLELEDAKIHSAQFNLRVIFLALHFRGEVMRGIPGSTVACEKSSDTGSTFRVGHFGGIISLVVGHGHFRRRVIMYLEQFYLTCLSHASYMIGSDGEAAVVDPQRDVDIYLKAAAEKDLKIRHIFETHLHADFVSGHKELAARTGAKIYIGAQANAGFPHVPLRDGTEVKVGRVRIRALETPGHTPESVCLVVTDEESANVEEGKSTLPTAVLTGDTLFIGDVGRPDLSKMHTPQQLAGLLYDSLHNKLMSLPDSVAVYPAHGAGSLCGRSMRAERSSTIGTERLTNHALQIPSREQFIAQVTANLPARPDYFLEDAEINRSGAAPLEDLPPLTALSPNDVREWVAQHANVLDVRSGEEYSAGHIPGSINIALAGNSPRGRVGFSAFTPIQY
jgi:Zn-dependent hydrolases, including glyoxylases